MPFNPNKYKMNDEKGCKIKIHENNNKHRATSNLMNQRNGINFPMINAKTPRLRYAYMCDV